MGKQTKVQHQPKAQPQPAAPYLVRYFDGEVKRQPFFSQQDAEKFYAALPVSPDDKTLVQVEGNKVLR